MIDRGQMIARLGGIEFGGLGDLIIQEFDPGDTEITVNDANIPMGDGVMVGRDFLGGKTWGFTLATNRADVEGARRTAAQLGAVWRSPPSGVPRALWCRCRIGSARSGGACMAGLVGGLTPSLMCAPCGASWWWPVISG